MAVFGVGIAGDLIGADDVKFLAGVRVSAGMDRSVRHDDRGLIVLEQGGQRANWRLVAGDEAMVPASPVALRCSQRASSVTSRPISE